jgi:hypothetical protein
MVMPVAVFTVIVTIIGMLLSYGNGNRLRFRSGTGKNKVRAAKQP